jgi:hypothetical protein
MRLDYAARLRHINNPLRLLVENELFRLGVWTNPASDVKRGVDYLGTTERNMMDVSIHMKIIMLTSDLEFSDLLVKHSSHRMADQSCHCHLSRGTFQKPVCS